MPNAEIDAAGSCSPHKIVFRARTPVCANLALCSPPCSMFFFLRGGFGIIPGICIDNVLSKKFAAMRRTEQGGHHCEATHTAAAVR